MPTIDLTVSKKFTLNTQNFSSVSPTVTISVKDLVDVEDLLKVHEILETIADGLFHKQLESDAKTMAVVKKLGFSEYFKKIKENGDIDEVLANQLEKLCKLPPF